MNLKLIPLFEILKFILIIFQSFVLIVIDFGGGVALYIKYTIPYTERKDLVPDNLEMICVEINRQHSRPFLITTWYRPPNSELDIFNNFELFLFKCDVENKELIIVGDLNCDVNKVPPHSQTHKLQTLSSLYQKLRKQHPH